jgi:hypothetical protein
MNIFNRIQFTTRVYTLLCIYIFQCHGICGQETVIKGTVLDGRTNNALSGVLVSMNESELFTKTNDQGIFLLTTELVGDLVLKITAKDFVSKQFPVYAQFEEIDLGTIVLDRDLTIERNDHLITLTEVELADDNLLESGSGLLQATRDIFLTRAAFDFGQAFYKVRGYDSRNGIVLLNGIPMYDLWSGRPQWNHWGGLNDITRNQEFVYGLDKSAVTFGGLLGSTNIDMSPSRLRPGLRISSSGSNRTYRGRLMATYNTGVNEKGWAFSFSASRRLANEGYIDGTLYDAYSLFSSLEYNWHQNHQLGITMILASNRRGKSSALTEEVFTLLGHNYNPYWGWQEGKIRNSRERRIRQPILMINYTNNDPIFQWNLGIAYQWGSQRNGRIGYYNAPNPDPTYYRNLPSYYVNSPIGANFISASIAREGLLNNSQWPWEQLYKANTGESGIANAAYVLYDDINKKNELTLNLGCSLKLQERFKIDAGVTQKVYSAENFAQLNDLFGSQYYLDKDPFSDTLNDVNGILQKETGAVINYKYNNNIQFWDAFIQTSWQFRQWDAVLAGSYSSRRFQRNGLFLNERYLGNSFGKSAELSFNNWGIKGGISFHPNSRHWVKANAFYGTRAPLLKHIFINPRETNEVVPNIKNEMLSSIDVNYLMRLPKLTGRLSGFFTRFQNTTDINFFYVDAGVGSDFVQEVVTGLDRVHMGFEAGLTYQPSPPIKLSLVASIGKHVYASNPMVTINFDTSGSAEDLIDIEGNRSLGISNIKDYKLAQGPQKAISIGLEYRDPAYWWIGTTANYLANNFMDISVITRTSSFRLDPETGKPDPNATEENIQSLLKQEPMPATYLLNMVGGKSWLLNGKYVSVFASINNLFDTIFKTGGYEQSRNGNYDQMIADNRSGMPSFGPKFWYSFGRTYFLNVAISF